MIKIFNKILNRNIEFYKVLIAFNFTLKCKN